MKVSFDLNREDFADLQKYDFKKNRLKKVIIVMIGTLVVLQLALNSDGFDLFATIISSLSAIIAIVLVVKRSLNRTYKIPDKNGAILGEKNFEFSEEKIIYSSNNSEGSYKWTTILSLEESKKSFFLYIDKHMAILIPKRAFSRDTEVAHFRNYVNSKISKS